MNTHVSPPPGRLTADEFWEFIKDRPREERWQLIDGEPFATTWPETWRHQRIGANLMRLLDEAIESNRPDLFAIHSIGLCFDDHPDSLVVADVAIVDFDVEDEVYGSRFYCAAEVLSASNTREHISRKRTRYSECPDCLYVLIIAQDDFAVEVWSRSNGWKGCVYRSPDDLIELPEFGFSCRVADLYRGTPVK